MVFPSSGGDAEAVPGRSLSRVLGCKHKVDLSSTAVCDCAHCHPHKGQKRVPKGHKCTPGKAALRQVTFVPGAKMNLYDNELQYIRKMLLQASGSN